MKRFLVLAVLAFSIAIPSPAQEMPNGRFEKLPGMQLPGIITREANGIPHVFALNKHDLYFLNGWLHAHDRLFQMDVSRRTASGTLGEILGSAAIPNDVQLRTLGLRRAAEATLPTLSASGRAALDAYSEGVNAYLASARQLPPEYSILEINKLDPWTPTDSLAVGKLLAFGLSFDLDIDRTVALLTYQAVGKIAGFNANTLFFADTFRIAPFSTAATIPDATGSGSTLPLRTAGRPWWESAGDASWIKPETLELGMRYLEQARTNPTLEAALNPSMHAGSNEWAIAGRNTTTGNAIVANDPHLSLGFPPNFYPISLRSGRTNVTGMGFPGAPFVIQGQNERIAWGSTVHPMDVTDVYQEQLVPQASSPSGFASIYKGTKENVTAIPQTFRINIPGNGVMNDLSVVPPSGAVPAATLVVPRHGPVVSLDTTTGIAMTVQYVGFYATHELEAFMLMDDSQNVDDFKAALQYFDVGSQNFAYADVDGNIAYFTSGELPIREDLQAGTVAGVPPFFIRNGQGGNEWIARTSTATQPFPFETLPFAEMPQVINPSNGWFVNANNDPIGQTLDNDPLNTPRSGGGILYLSPGYDQIRAGRITQTLRQKLAAGKVSPDDVKAMQADVVLYDAQVFVPFITKALTNAKASGANNTLTALGADAAINAAVTRLGKWDFSSPTGLASGYDASDVNGALSTPSQQEIDNSVAATLYSMWRSRFLASTMDVVLKAMSLPLPPDQNSLSSLRYLLEHFDQTGGVGAAGVSFFNVPGVTDASARRDILILKSVGDALTLLSSDAFASAFNRSTDLGDYRWGKLHRIVFSHVITPIFSPGSTFGPPPLASIPGLNGLSTDGGFSTVDASSHSARASTLNGFMFGSGPNRRYVGDMAKDGIRGESSLPGGVSGIANDPFSTNLLMLWLTNDTFSVRTDAAPRIPWLR